MTNQAKPRIFLCHAKEDKPRVRELYHQLKAAGYNPWLDEEDLLPGVDWEREIRRAIRGSEIFLACLSQKSLTRKGYIHKEIKLALDELDKMPEDKIYLIPVRLEHCTVPDRLEARQWVDLFEPRGFEKLMRALDAELGPPAPAPIEPELINIPAGDFLMGSDPNKDKDAQEDEQPQHTVYLPKYHIARTPVSNAEYAWFVEDTFHEVPDHWMLRKPPAGKENHPVVNVNWYDAMAYCKWLANITGNAYRLPTEAEWEKAARGANGQIYPWGNDLPDERRCNFNEIVSDTTPRGQYSPGGDSPYGCVDMAGNVWEWVNDWYDSDYYVWSPSQNPSGPETGDRKVLRGGSWRSDGSTTRTAHRSLDLPVVRYAFIGFRCVAGPGG